MTIYRVSCTNNSVHKLSQLQNAFLCNLKQNKKLPTVQGDGLSGNLTAFAILQVTNLCAHGSRVKWRSGAGIEEWEWGRAHLDHMLKELCLQLLMTNSIVCHCTSAAFLFIFKTSCTPSGRKMVTRTQMA